VLRELLNDTIQSPDDLKQLTDTPQLGLIALSKTGEQVVVRKESRSAIAEMFRLLRTNLQFLHNSAPPHTFMVTSSASGEGKSFITINLGLTFALSGKKTCLWHWICASPKSGNTWGKPSQRKASPTY
jgi:tyrosine-protein kinase Etk/Wzc